ncbi:hypothetical protein V8F44DRAFT_173763 [Aspergillus fumigatus]
MSFLHTELFEPRRWSDLFVSVLESLVQRPEIGMSSICSSSSGYKTGLSITFSCSTICSQFLSFLYTTCVFSVISLLMTWYLVIPNTSGVPNTTSIWRHHACFFSFQIWLAILPDGVFPIPL